MFYAERLKSLDALPAQDDPVWLLPTSEFPHVSQRLRALSQLAMRVALGIPHPFDTA
jgi:hypothetical protein